MACASCGKNATSIKYELRLSDGTKEVHDTRASARTSSSTNHDGDGKIRPVRVRS